MRDSNVMFFLNRAILCFLILFSATASGQSEAGNAENDQKFPPYRLGVILGLTGAGALYSNDGLNAIKLAADEINAKGGFLGKHKIELHIRDTETKPNIAFQKATELVLKEQVLALLGTYSSASAMAVKPVSLRYQVLFINAISNSENITKNNFNPYTFSVCPNSYMQANAVARYVTKLAKERNWKTFATIASDYEWGRTTQDNFLYQLKRKAPQLRLVMELWPRLGQSTFESEIAAVNATHPDFVYGSLASQDNANWIQFANNSNFFKKYAFPGSLLSLTELIQYSDTLPRGLIGLARAPFFAHMDNPAMVDFVSNYRQRFGQYPTDWAVLEYDAVMTLMQGIEMANSVDPTKVRNALVGATIMTTRGQLTFRHIDNQLNCSSYVGIVSDVPEYPFPIYKNLIEVKGDDSWRPEHEILSFR